MEARDGLPSGWTVLLAMAIGCMDAGGSADAELIWPDDPRAAAWLAFDARFPVARPSSAWPKTLGEVCARVFSLPTGDSAVAGRAPERSDPAFTALRAACSMGSPGPAPVSATVHIGAHALGKTEPLGPTFEEFGGNWRSLRTDPELARAWSDVPPAVKVELRHGFSPRAFVYFRLGLRRDLAAWRRDDLSSNIPLAAGEVDINEPSLGYFRYEGGYASVTVGRFPTHWSPSPDFGLALSRSVPFHNGVEISLKLPRATYRFLVSSLNPWLEGTPSGDTSGEGYPVGSEEWRQRNYPHAGPAANAHRRVFDARVKTLLAHRLEAWVGPLILGVTESQVVGGKIPDLRDANPFTIFHNDYREGYSNNNVTIDVLARLPLGLSAGAELFMDDLDYSETEAGGEDGARLGWLGVVRHGFRAAGWAWIQSLHAIWTEPFLYRMPQPLNTYSSRHVIMTNHEDQDSPGFFDRMVADYPIGYLRGGDALDFRYRLDAIRGGMGVGFGAAWLSRGEIDQATPFELSRLPHGSAPSGVAEEELRLEMNARMMMSRELSLGAGTAYSHFWNRDHVEGAADRALRVSAGVTWTFSP